MKKALVSQGLQLSSLYLIRTGPTFDSRTSPLLQWFLTVEGETFKATAQAVAEGNSLSPFLLSITMTQLFISSPTERPDFLSPGPFLIIVYFKQNTTFNYFQLPLATILKST